MTGTNDRTRLSQLGRYCTPIPEIPPTLSPTRNTQPALCSADLPPAVLAAGPLAILAQLQSDVHMLKMALPVRSSPGPGPQPMQRRSVRFANTAVPRFNGDTCWDQHKQVFYAIVKSNGWGDETATLQLLAHLEGYAFNVTLLLPEAQRATGVGWQGPSLIITDLRGDWRSTDRGLRKLSNETERTERTEDPSIFATELETLAVRAFGDVGPGGRIRMVRDWFVTGHRDCDLRRHLDSVTPDTPIREIVDRCRVWESHSDAYNHDEVAPTFTVPGWPNQ